MIDRAAQDGADLICMPEIFAMRHLSTEQAVEQAEPIPGTTTDAIGDAARRNGCYAIATTVEEHRGRAYNTSALIDRAGEVVGVYRKMFPTIGEMEAGITPGTEAPVFEADFGRVGMAICWDLHFLELGRGLAERGAQVICWSSMYQGGFQLKVWAYLFGCYMMSSWGGNISEIVDMNGYTLAATNYGYPIASADVNFDREVFVRCTNLEKMNAVREKYGAGIDLELMHAQGTLTIASKMADVTVAHIAEEFELDTRRDYYARYHAARERALR